MSALRLRPATLLFILLAATLVAGCSSLMSMVEETDPPTATVGEHHLATMVLPHEELGLLGEGLRLDPAESGYVDHAHAAEDFSVLQLTADDLIALGRVNGYQLSFSAAAARGPAGGVYGANSSVDLFERSGGARQFLDRIEEEMELTAGTDDERVHYDEVVPFAVRGLGDEARGYRVVMSIDGYASPYVGSVIVFRYGRLVAAATVSQFGDDDMQAEALDLAETLEERIDLSVEGRLIATPVPLVTVEDASGGVGGSGN